MPEAHALKAGAYRMTFAVGDYFRIHGSDSFYDLVPLQFKVARPPRPPGAERSPAWLRVGSSGPTMPTSTQTFRPTDPAGIGTWHRRAVPDHASLRST